MVLVEHDCSRASAVDDSRRSRVGCSDTSPTTRARTGRARLGRLRRSRLGDRTAIRVGTRPSPRGSRRNRSEGTIRADGRRCRRENGTRRPRSRGLRPPVDVSLEPTDAPVPDELYHGTAPGNLESIRSEGLRPMSRQHVHLSGVRRRLEPSVGDTRPIPSFSSWTRQGCSPTATGSRNAAGRRTRPTRYRRRISRWLALQTSKRRQIRLVTDKTVTRPSWSLQ